ncbi:hypothetical protein HDU85_005174 [Gaertneriomyces sp. JEL0708]|nr:hypothetical protein HDU85_005174 [Gaertneriomyces sp. JEL0708]
MGDNDKAPAMDETPVDENEKAPQTPHAPQAPSMGDNDRKRKRSKEDPGNVTFIIQQRRCQFNELLSESLGTVQADTTTAAAEITRVSAASTKLIQTVVKVTELGILSCDVGGG